MLVRCWILAPKKNTWGTDVRCWIPSSLAPKKTCKWGVDASGFSEWGGILSASGLWSPNMVVVRCILSQWLGLPPGLNSICDVGIMLELCWHLCSLVNPLPKGVNKLMYLVFFTLVFSTYKGSLLFYCLSIAYQKVLSGLNSLYAASLDW